MTKSSQRGAAKIPYALPRGTHHLSRDVVEASQRERMLDAITELCATKGFAQVTVAEIVGLASVGKTTFYELFDDKEACFIAAYERAVGEAVKIMAAETSGPFRPEERIRRALRAILRFVADDEHRARLLLLEPFAAGPQATAKMMATHRLAERIYIQGRETAREHWPEYPPISEVRAQAIIGAVNAPMTAAVQAGRARSVLALEDELLRTITAMALAP
ncbi:TetR/AcrR family transcriptional regulator [Pendulispora brunnea]|uniref:TetR/AcrR family transcriptional regulator n=1 Tax=Pendulispora brunnea TaxID=2905690 RepID=A0ABZ2KNY0_9BACT